VTVNVLTLYVATCNGCAGQLDEDGGEYRNTPEEALAAILADGADWGDWIVIGDVALCPDCQDREDEDDDIQPRRKRSSP
jgi:hypothetical protein